MPGASALGKRTPRQRGDAPVSPRLAAWHRLMTEASSNATILVLGDSTGDGLTRWPRLLANYIAAQWPAWTVVYAPWDDPSKTYPAGSRVTVQTGTNGRTLTIWNCSVSGQVISYARDNMATITSGLTPDLIFFNYGHNSPQLADNYRYIHTETFMRYCNAYPKAAVVTAIQNPRDAVIWATTSPTYADDQGRQRAIFEFSVDNGIPTVDVNADFRAYGPYGTDLLNGDGLHPSDAAGSPRWAKLTWDVVRPTGGPILAPGHQPDSNRIWIPADRFRAIDGTPTLTTDYGLAAWEMTHAADSSVAATVDIPTAWKAQNIHLLTTATVNGSAGNQQVFTGYHMYVGTSTGIGGSVTLGTWVQDSTVTAGAQYTAGKTADNVLWDRTALGAAPVALKVYRNATNASDTYTAGNVAFLGLMIERAY